MHNQQAIARWNPDRDVWESPTSEHSDVFSETWPTSGMMRNGEAFELPTLEPPIEDSGYLWLRTPTASEGRRGVISPALAKETGKTLMLSGQMVDLFHPGVLPQSSDTSPR